MLSTSKPKNEFYESSERFSYLMSLCNSDVYFKLGTRVNNTTSKNFSSVFTCLVTSEFMMVLFSVELLSLPYVQNLSKLDLKFFCHIHVI